MYTIKSMNKNLRISEMEEDALLNLYSRDEYLHR